MANFNFNKVIIGGRITADPELKTTPSGVSVTSFSVAVNRRFGNKNGEEQQADFFNVTAWRQTAEFITRYFRKASSICVEGTLQTRNWTDQNGQKHYMTEIIADNAYFVDSKSETPASIQNGAPMYSQQPPTPSYVPEGYSGGAYQNQTAPKFEEISDDEELPF